jgi:hypothetical protein
MEWRQWAVLGLIVNATGVAFAFFVAWPSTLDKRIDHALTDGGPSDAEVHEAIQRRRWQAPVGLALMVAGALMQIVGVATAP